MARPKPSRGARKSDPRHRLLARIHCAKRDLGLSDGDYRALLENEAGARSCAGLDLPELARVDRRLRDLGQIAPAPAPSGEAAKKRSDRPEIRRLWAVWYSLGRAGALREPNWRSALRSWLRKNYGVDDPEFLDRRQSNRAIQRLQQWERRVTGAK